MLTKICLILAILASAGTIALTHLRVDAKFQEKDAEIAKVSGERDEANQEKTKTAAELSKTKTTLTETTTKLTAATKDAEASRTKAADAEAKAAKSAQEADAAKQEVVRITREVQEIVNLKLTAEQIKKNIADLAAAKKSVAALQNENKVFKGDIAKMEAEIKLLKGFDDAPPMPGVKGTVVSVDPKWDFVVVNVGAQGGALANGELKISRGGQLIGKLKLVRVEKTYSVANVMKAFKKGDVLEGDLAIY